MTLYCQDEFSTVNTKLTSDEIHGFGIVPYILDYAINMGCIHGNNSC